MQAARGASLSDAGDSGTTAHPTRPTGRRLWPLVIGVAVVGLAIDQITKALAVAHLVPGVPHDLVGSALRLNRTSNPGAAFSTGTSHTAIFSALAIVATVAVLWLSRRVGSVVWAVALGVLLAGIVGNLIDRIARPPAVFRGQVVDFLEFPHWPIFNIADCCITVAAVLILIQAARGIRLDGQRERAPESSPVAAAATSPARETEAGAGRDDEAAGGPAR
jgi:signal peptidase II